MIKELCEQHGVTCVFTSKLFFNRFTSSITINFPAELHQEHIENDRTIRELFEPCGGKARTNQMIAHLKREGVRYNGARQAFINDLFARFDRVFPDSAEYRMNKVSVTFYHDDPIAMAELVKPLRDMIVKVTVPHNESEIAFLRANTDKRIEDRYYYDCYPFKIVFRPLYDKKTYVDSYVAEHFGEKVEDETEIDASRAFYYNDGNQPLLYINDMTDFILTHVGVGELIDRVEEIVLRSY